MPVIKFEGWEGFSNFHPSHSVEGSFNLLCIEVSQLLKIHSSHVIPRFFPGVVFEYSEGEMRTRAGVRITVETKEGKSSEIKASIAQYILKYCIANRIAEGLEVKFEELSSSTVFVFDGENMNCVL